MLIHQLIVRVLLQHNERSAKSKIDSGLWPLADASLKSPNPKSPTKLICYLFQWDKITMATQTRKRKRSWVGEHEAPKYKRTDIPDRFPRLSSETVKELIDWKKMNRSYEMIDDKDLERLCELAEEDYQEFCRRYPKYKQLANSRMAICLCQGAALHYVDRRVGVRDFDVFTFYDQDSTVKWPYRRRTVKDFGDAKFGKTLPMPGAKVTYDRFTGRNVDIMARQIPNTGDYKDSIQNWLKAAETQTAYYLSQKAVVILWPPEDRGSVLWGPQ